MDNPQLLIMRLVGLLLGITIHECAHAYVAFRLGDDTAERLGRVSLNPVVHLDPLGAMMMFFVMLGYAPIGWGKPVPINVNRIQGGRRGLAWSSLAGPASNLLLATIFALPFTFGLADGMSQNLQSFLTTVISVNAGLAAFNFVPLPPLDGFNTLSGLLPGGWVRPMEELRRPASAILMILIILPWLGQRLNMLNLNVNVLSAMVGPLYGMFLKLLVPVGGCCRIVHDE
ncbi:MAG TPA: site-2 protease family protein [Herpetosiphonaceae bacterium]